MSNDYLVEEKKKDTITAPDQDGFKDIRQSVFAVVLSAIVGLWVMFTMAVGADVGVNWFIFVLLSVVSVAVMMYLDDNLHVPQAIFWLVVIAVISSTFFRTYNFPVLTFLFLPTAVVFFTIFAAKKPEENIVANSFTATLCFSSIFGTCFWCGSAKRRTARRGTQAKCCGVSAYL